MKNKKRSIRTIIAVIILGVMIPVNLFTLVIYWLLYGQVKDMVVEAQKSTIEVYASQWGHQLEGIEKYVLKTVNDARWRALGGDKGSQGYELTKVALQRDIQDGTSDSVWSQADSICIYIPGTGDMLTSYNSTHIMYEENELLREWTSAQKLQSWQLIECEGREYICLNYGGPVFNLAVFVRPETIISTWNDSSGFIMEITQSSQPREKDNYERVAVPFLDKGLEMSVYLPGTYINQAMPIQYFLLFCSIMAGFAMILLIYLLLRKYLIRPLGKTQETIERIRRGDREQRIAGCSTTTEMQAIENSFNSLMDDIYNLEIKNYEIEIENQKAQLMNLQLQINPHLLLNTLNTIYGLSEIEDYKSIQNFTLNLVKYFRYSLKHMDELVTLGQELDFVRSYVAVQSVRYPDAFYVLYDVEDELLGEYIPPLIIENFVENSTKYSLNKKMTEVLVIVKKKEGYLNISICDNGEGIEESVLKVLRSGQPYIKDGVTHVGIYNCIRRLRLFYGPDMEFSITSSPGEGTQVWIELPCVREEDKHEFTAGGR